MTRVATGAGEATDAERVTVIPSTEVALINAKPIAYKFHRAVCDIILPFRGAFHFVRPYEYKDAVADFAALPPGG